MTQLTDEQLDELERLAEAATPGPWRHYANKLCPQFPNRIHEVQASYRGKWREVVRWAGFDGQKNAKKDATYIAAADPPTVLALVREVRRLRSENFRLNELVQYRFHGAVTSDVAVVPIEDYEAMKARIVDLEAKNG